MGQSSAETVREIEEARGRLESDIRELEQRLPAPAVWAKRVAGLAVGGGLGGTAFWFAVKRLRNRGKNKKKKARCLWLKSNRAKFKRRKPKHGRCDKPVWLRATGTTAWTYKLRPHSPAERTLVPLVRRHRQVFEELRAAHPAGVAALRKTLGFDDF